MLARLALALVVIVLVGACSSDDDGASPAGSEGSVTSVSFTGRAPDEISAPPAAGKGVNLPQPAVAAADDYVEEELFLGGTATRFDAVDTPDDGSWSAVPAEEAPYRTRVIVRRPPADHFSGTVVVEWFNVSAIEAAPDWAYLSEEISREGHAYIGVSAQAQGVEGGDTILDVEVDPAAAADTGTTVDTSGLRNIDPERYGTLQHPGDAYSFDIFSQVARAAKQSPDQLIGGLRPTQVIGIGESQSAIFMSTLANAVHPLDPTFDGFLIHSRGADVAPLDGQFVRASTTDTVEIASRAVLVRTDLDVPVLLFETETDLTLLGYAHARQPDTENVRTWEVAGTAHSDAHVLRAIVGGPRDGSVGSLLGCDTLINTGPHHEVVQAALHQLVRWASGGQAPPQGEPIELEDGDEVAIARDDTGMALGGVRNPLVDVPVAVVTGDPPDGATIDDLASGDGDLCILFGATTPLDQASLVARYGTADAYVTAFRASADAAVASGFLLRPDADALIAEAEQNRALFG